MPDYKAQHEVDKAIKNVPGRYIATVPKYLIHACYNFSKVCIDTNFKMYTNRGQQPEEIVKQMTLGKIAEFGTWVILKNNNITCEPPEMEVLPEHKKSYAADLKSIDFDFHVKTQEYKKAVNYGLSWLMQKNDPAVIKPADNEVICLTLIKGNTVYLMHRERAKNLVSKYSEPKKEALRKTKTALYFKTLKVK